MSITLMATFLSIVILITSIMGATLIVTLVAILVVVVAREVTLDGQAQAGPLRTCPGAAMPDRYLWSFGQADETETRENPSLPIRDEKKMLILVYE
jgi:hypothetical protein